MVIKRKELFSIYWKDISWANWCSLKSMGWDFVWGVGLVWERDRDRDGARNL